MKCDPWQLVDKLLKHNESTTIVHLNAVLQQYLVSSSCSVCVQLDLDAQLLDTQLRHCGHLFIAWLFPGKIRGGLSTRIYFIGCFLLYKLHSWSSIMPTQKEVGTAMRDKVQRPNSTEAYLLLSVFPKCSSAFLFLFIQSRSETYLIELTE